MTANREDYLKQILKLGGDKKTVSNKEIAESLGLSPASVSEMLSKLKKEGLIEYEAYRRQGQNILYSSLETTGFGRFF